MSSVRITVAVRSMSIPTWPSCAAIAEPARLRLPATASPARRHGASARSPARATQARRLWQHKRVLQLLGRSGERLPHVVAVAQSAVEDMVHALVLTPIVGDGLPAIVLRDRRVGLAERLLALCLGDERDLRAH